MSIKTTNLVVELVATAASAYASYDFLIYGKTYFGIAFAFLALIALQTALYTIVYKATT